MSLHALRRWIARHPAGWVLGLALGLGATLGGAQLVAACHEITHVLADAGAEAQDAPSHHEHANGSHDCPTCLLAAALGAAATAPPTLSMPTPDITVSALAAVEHDFTPRFTRPYASRAPPTGFVTIA